MRLFGKKKNTIIDNAELNTNYPEEQKLQAEPVTSPEATEDLSSPVPEEWVKPESEYVPAESDQKRAEESAVSAKQPDDAPAIETEEPKTEMKQDAYTAPDVKPEESVKRDPEPGPGVNPGINAGSAYEPRPGVNPEMKARPAYEPRPGMNPGAYARPEYDPRRAPAAPPVRPEQKTGKLDGIFGNKPISRKFFTIALAAAVVLNSVLTAGLLTLFSHGKGKPDLPKNGRPDTEQIFGEDNNDSNDNSSNSLTPPENNQNGTPWGDNDNGSQWGDNNGNPWGDYDDYDSPWGDDDDQTPWGSNGNGSQWGDDDMQKQYQDPSQGLQGQENSGSVSIGIVISENDGVYIAQVSGDNAAAAGFKEGDKVVEFDGTKISTSNDLISEVQKHKSGDEVTVTVERDGKKVDIKTTLQ